MFNLKAKFIIAATVLVLGVSAANAQIADGTSIKINVPSSFVVRDVKFPAGVYTIERTPTTADSSSLLIIRGEGESMIFDTMVSSSNQASAKTQLVFDTVDGVNYLSEILVKGQTSKNELTKTKAQATRSADTVAIRYIITLTDTGF
ncbi:MAG: hypothetical protein WBO10_04245 [Pyrinomonadaceae bacterium]